MKNHVVPKNNHGLIVLAFLFLASSQFLSYVNIDATLHSKVFRVLSAILLLYLVVNFSKIKSKSNHYPSFGFVTYFACAPFITHLSCYLVHGQSIISSISVSAACLIFFIYFFCILKDIKSEQIIRFLAIIAVIKIVLTLIQQFTYPEIMFSFTSDKIDDEGIFRPIEYRSGFYRFLISDAYYLSVFLGFFSFCHFIKTKSTGYFILFLVACFGIFMDQSRQIMFVFFIGICLFPFIINSRESGKKLQLLLLLVLFLTVLALNFDSLFGELAERTERETQNDSYVRFLEYEYFLRDLGGWLSTLFGNGWAGASKYGDTIRSMQEDYSMFRPDIGIVGSLHKMGLVFILVFLFYYLVVVRKNWKYIDPEYRLVLLFILLDTPLIFPLYNFTLPSIECFMGMFFYLVDLSIRKNRQCNLE